MCGLQAIGEKIKVFDKLELPSASEFEDHEKWLISSTKTLDKLSTDIFPLTDDLRTSLNEAIQDGVLSYTKDKKLLQAILVTLKQAVDTFERYERYYNTKLYFKVTVDEHAPALIERIVHMADGYSLLIENIELGLKHGKQFNKLGKLFDEYSRKVPIETIEVKDLFD